MATNFEAPPQVVCPHCKRQIDHVLCCYLSTKELNRPPAPVPPTGVKGMPEPPALSYAQLYACPHCRTVLGGFANNNSYIGTINISADESPKPSGNRAPEGVS